MEGITIFCKSYRKDLSRAAELAESVRRFNSESLPFYISVPGDDLALFKNQIGTGDIQWLRDEDIIEANPKLSYERYRSFPGQFSQQIIKAEFWRANPLPSYLWVDSDSLFIKEFRKSDFIASDNTPYTVMYQGLTFHAFCLAQGLEKDIAEFEHTKTKFKDLFGRRGPSYNFGPSAVTWHFHVWRDLESNYLVPNGMTIIDALTLLPSEAFWYGEALLKYRSIDIVPREPFFKAYLFLEEYEHDRKTGITELILRPLYYGITYQSNWYPKRLALTKKYAYYFKKIVKRFLSDIHL